MNRRAFLSGAIGVAAARTQQQAPVSSTPSNRDFMRQDPIQYPDPDIIALDNRFRRYIVGNTPIRRLHFGTLWAEGPAWNGVGRYLVWSDIPNNVQMRWIEDDGRVTVFRNPSGYSNGNTFDYEGRQLSCEHGGRRVVRYEPNGTVTVIAEKFQGKRLNSPNDVVVHPDGSIWFTDPPYGIRGNYEGFKADSELPTAELKKEMKSVKGVGDYAAENLLKLVGRYDGLALDSFLRGEFYKKHNGEQICNDKEIDLFYEKFGSWRGLAMWCDMTEKWHD